MLEAQTIVLSPKQALKVELFIKRAIDEFTDDDQYHLAAIIISNTINMIKHTSHLGDVTFTWAERRDSTYDHLGVPDSKCPSKFGIEDGC